MNIILGASGQVGSAITDFLADQNVPVKGVIRNPEKAEELKDKGAAVSIADYFNVSALTSTLKGGEAIFVLTPETGKSEDVLGDTKILLENYRSAIESSPIKKVVGLSSIGAQHASGTGNLQMSYMLEHAFGGMPVQQIFVRATYFYSNWLPHLTTVREEGILPTFFPTDLEITMVSPIDVAEFIAEVMISDIEESKIYELEGPEAYSSIDVANTFGKILDRKVEAQQIPRTEWEDTLQQIGFTEDAVKNFIEMTEAVIEGKTGPEKTGIDAVELPTTLKQYFKENLKSL